VKLSANFEDHELGISSYTEARIRDNAKYLCEQLLEPIASISAGR
jgi:hypothetical protein